jgi:hypothetical protein
MPYKQLLLDLLKRKEIRILILVSTYGNSISVFHLFNY